MSIADHHISNAECRWPADDCRKPKADIRQPLADRCAKIRMLVIDVDGVLTDGRIIYSEDGVELKAFHVRDGTGLKIWQQQGLGVAIITGRTSRAVQMRAAELGIGKVVQGAADKLSACRRLLDDSGLCFDQVCAIGDELIGTREEGVEVPVLAAVVEGTGVKVQRLAAITAVTDDIPCGDDPFASGYAKGRDARGRFAAGSFVGVAQGQGLRLAAPEHPLIDVSAPVPVPGGAVVVMKLDDDVVAGPVAECDGPGGGLRRLRGGTGARREVFMRPILAVRQGSHDGQGHHQGGPNRSHRDHRYPVPRKRLP